MKKSNVYSIAKFAINIETANYSQEKIRIFTFFNFMKGHFQCFKG